MKYKLIQMIAISALLSTHATSANQSITIDSKPSISNSKKAKPYTLKTCIVSDEELGSMGDPITVIYKEQEFKLCCKPCIKKFKKDPEKYLKLLAKKTK